MRLAGRDLEPHDPVAPPGTPHPGEEAEGADLLGEELAGPAVDVHPPDRGLVGLRSARQ